MSVKYFDIAVARIVDIYSRIQNLQVHTFEDRPGSHDIRFEFDHNIRVDHDAFIEACRREHPGFDGDRFMTEFMIPLSRRFAIAYIPTLYGFMGGVKQVRLEDEFDFGLN